MYGAYVEVAAYSQAWDRRSSESLIHNEALLWLSPERPQLHSSSSAIGDPPWLLQNYTLEDFILVSEVSEIEGPKPLFTIPQHIDSYTDVNTLAEKIMSVDYHSGNSGPFLCSSDTQVILSNVADGLHAFAEYFILYDISARGFVRPICIAYFTTDKKKLVDFFEDIRLKFLEISRYLKFGNRRLFLQELEQYLEDLQIAKDEYVKKCQNTEPKDKSENVENAFESAIINQFATSIIEAQHLLSAKRPILEDAVAAALFWKVETKIRTNYNRTLYQIIKPFVLAEPMHSPKLDNLKQDVKSLKMRYIFELCSWGIAISLDLMISMQKYFKRDSVLIYMENEDLKYLEPEHGRVLIGNHVIANTTINLLEPPCKKSLYMNFDEEPISIDRNLSELQALFLMVKPSLNKPNSPYSDLEVSFFDSDSDSDIYDDACDGSTSSLPYISPMSSETCNDASVGDCSEATESPGKESFWSVLESLRGSPEIQVESEEPKRCERRLIPCDINSSFTKQGTRTIHSWSLANYLEFLTPDKPGFGIASVFNQFSSFPHIIYSLLVGRPVIVIGTSSHEDLVRSVVQAFAIFVPERGRSTTVIPWCTNSLKMTDFNNVWLMGLCVPDHQIDNCWSPISSSSHLSLVNVAKNTYQGPQYIGNVLSSLFHVQRKGWNDTALIAYLHSLIAILGAYICLYHHSLSLSESVAGKISNTVIRKKTRDSLLSALSVNRDDCAIIKYLAGLLLDD